MKNKSLKCKCANRKLTTGMISSNIIELREEKKASLNSRNEKSFNILYNNQHKYNTGVSQQEDQPVGEEETSRKKRQYEYHENIEKKDEEINRGKNNLQDIIHEENKELNKEKSNSEKDEINNDTSLTENTFNHDDPLELMEKLASIYKAKNSD